MVIKVKKLLVAILVGVAVYSACKAIKSGVDKFMNEFDLSDLI